ncbi:hypothetical protein Q604_UNBC17404G0001, partial [human gut metagenome]
ITEWKEFEIKELFTINPTKYHRLTNKDLMQDDGENPVIVNSSFNNGLFKIFFIYFKRFLWFLI